MTNHALNLFIDGAIFVEFAVAALFFLRFWLRSQDRFFLLFSIAFCILALNRGAIAAMVPSRSEPSEAYAILYGIRLLAFLILLVAIADKNRAAVGKAAGFSP